MIIDFKELAQSPGYKKLKAAVLYHIKGSVDRQNKFYPELGVAKMCFNPVGCNRSERIPCFHRYCSKFRWIIDRAQHYSHHTGIPVVDILNAWEDDRSYSFNNYYQDANQPKLTDARVLVFSTVQEFIGTVGKKGFRCPACGGVSSNPYECKSGIIVKKDRRRRRKRVPCDWKVYGLFQDLGKGLYVYIKEKARGERIFMPIVLEEARPSEQMPGV